MVGCLFLGLVLSLLGLAVLLIPLGTALSFGQGAVVTALLGAAAWTAWAAWRDGGPLALILDVDGTEQCFPALPEDAAGCVALELESDGDVVRVYRAPPTAPGLGGGTFAETAPPATERPRLELRRSFPGSRRGSLSLTRGRTSLWVVGDIRVGRRVPLSDTAARAIGLDPERPAGIVFLDR